MNSYMNPVFCLDCWQIDYNDPSGRKIVLAELGIKAGETA